MNEPSSSSRNTRLVFAPLVLSVCASLAALEAAAQQPVRRATSPERSGPLAARAIEVTAGPGFFVVTDGAKRRLAVYAVDGGTVRLIAIRDLDADFESKGAEAMHPGGPHPPATDAAGQDPPGFPRPERSVRVQSTFLADRKSGDGRWDARYLVPGEVAMVFGGLKASLPGWSVERESVTASPAAATLVVARPPDRLEIVIGDRFAPDGWSTIDVTLSRRQN